MIFNETNTEDGKPRVFDHLMGGLFPSPIDGYSVIDIGGAHNPWAKDYTTAYLDILDIREYLKAYPHLLTDKVKKADVFIGDICHPSGWEEVNAWVKANGKFDFSICTQTIEDIRDPIFVLEQLAKMSKMGFISVPCKHSELCVGIECSVPEHRAAWGTNSDFRGYFHHRWIFTIKEGRLHAYPKLSFIDHMTGLEWADRDNKDRYFHEMSFMWEGDIPYTIISDDYLGPNGKVILDLYRDTIREGI